MQEETQLKESYNKKQSDSRHQTSLMERSIDREDFDEKMRKKRNLSKQSEDYSECTFHPEVSRTSSKTHNKHFQREEIIWLEKKRERLAMIQAQKMEGECTFKPKINKSNKKYAETSIQRSREPIGDRLYQQALAQEKMKDERRKSQLKEEAIKPSFKESAQSIGKPRKRTSSKTESKIVKYENEPSPFLIGQSDPVSFDSRFSHANPYLTVAQPLASVERRDRRPTASFNPYIIEIQKPSPYPEGKVFNSEHFQEELEENSDVERKSIGSINDFQFNQIKETVGKPNAKTHTNQDSYQADEMKKIQAPEESEPESNELHQEVPPPQDSHEPRELKSAWASKGAFRRSTIKELFRSLYNDPNN